MGNMSVNITPTIQYEYRPEVHMIHITLAAYANIKITFRDLNDYVRPNIKYNAPA